MIDSFTFGSLEEVSDWIKRLKPLNGDIIHIRYENNRFKCFIKSKSINAIEEMKKQIPRMPYYEYGEM